MKSSITCDMEGRILTMNDAAETIFGYKKEELINKEDGVPKFIEKKIKSA